MMFEIRDRWNSPEYPGQTVGENQRGNRGGAAEGESGPRGSREFFHRPDLVGFTRIGPDTGRIQAGSREKEEGSISLDFPGFAQIVGEEDPYSETSWTWEPHWRHL
jgi:hypothetical protein